MDVFSHFALPYLAMWLARRPHRERLAAAVGAFAPDADVLTAPLAAFVPELYFFGHRGVSHTLIGAPLYALALVLILRAPLWSRWTRHAEPLRFGWRLGAIAVLFSFTHVALDALTMWGVPAAWPFSDARHTTGWFFYSVLAMIPFSAYLVWRILRGEATPRRLRIAGAFIIAALLLSSGIRAATYPRAADADIAHPTSGEWAWITFEHDPTGWNATFWTWGREVGNATYNESPPTDDDAAWALALAERDLAYKKFHLYAGGPITTQVNPREGGGWNITFMDLMTRTQMDRAPEWLRFSEDRGILRLAVVDDVVRKI